MQGMSDDDSNLSREDNAEASERVSKSNSEGEGSGSDPAARPEMGIAATEGIKAHTGVFTTPDGLDPSTKAALDEENKNFEIGMFSGFCGKCGNPIVPGPAVMCSIPGCGIIVHQFCFDAHVVAAHRPDGITLKIEKNADGKFLWKRRKVKGK